MQHLFISYARNDGEEFAKKLHDSLEAHGFLAWLDRRDLKPGDSWDLSIDRAIHNCWAVLFVMTPSGVNSPNCHDEWSRALSFKKPVLPLMVIQTIPPMRLHRFQYVDFTGNFEPAIEKLLEHLEFMQTAEGELQGLRDRMKDLHQQAKESDRPDAVQMEIMLLQEQINYKQRVLENPAEAQAEYRHNTQIGLDAERKRLVDTRERERTLIRKRIVGSAPQGVSELFKNRESELATITNLLLSPDSDIRAVSIYGMGGTGKTALACRVMQELEKEREKIHGLIYLSKRSVGISLERIFLDSARMLGGKAEIELHELWSNTQIETQAKIQALLEHYDKRSVILLDNLEDLIDDQTGVISDADLKLFVETFLRQRHQGRLLVTSREPLTLPPDARRHEKIIPLEQGLPLQYGVELLRALDADGMLGLSDADPKILQTAVEKTLGYPRALEAIAGLLAQDPFLTLQAVLDDVSLFGEMVIENLIREAQSRLDQDAQRVMQALAVYDRPVTETALRFLLEPFAIGLSIDSTVRRLARGRYITVKRSTGELIIHPLDKEYSYRHIPTAETDEYNLKALHRRASAYYAQLRTPQDTWKSILDIEPQFAEFDHLMKAGEYAAATALIDELDYKYLTPWGHARRVLTMRESLIGKLSDPALDEANTGRLGNAYHFMGQVERATKHYRRALDLARQMNNRQAESTRLGHLGIAYVDQGRFAEAIEYYQQALAIAEEIGDKRGIGRHLGNLGVAYRELVQIEQALDYYERALKISRDMSNRASESKQLGNLANAYVELGQMEKAIQFNEESLAIAREIGDRPTEELTLGNLGHVYREIGQLDKSTSVTREALEMSRESGNRGLEALWLNNLGRIESALSETDQAIKTLKEALEASHEVDENETQHRAGTNLARVYLSRGELALALKTIITARQHKIEEYLHIAAALHGVILARMGKASEACGAFHEAINHADELLAKTPGYYTALYTKALAQAGLALLENYDSLVLSKYSYRKAYSVCSAEGVIQDAHHLWEELVKIDTAGILPTWELMLFGND